MNKFIALHKKSTQNKLRNIQSKNPKEYWKFINSLKRKTCLNTPTLEEFYEHFKILNFGDPDANCELNFDNTQNNEILNSKITSDEILRCIRNLNNGKASGSDRIVNEHIKSTSQLFFCLFTKSFLT